MSDAFRTTSDKSAASTLPAGPPDSAPAKVSTRFLEAPGANGLQIRIDEIGRGIPVVFMHGLVGVNSHWMPTAEAIQHRVRCVMMQLPLLQLRGALCNVEGAAAVATDALETILNNQPAILVGSSFGGHVALRVALNRPDMIRAMVLTGSSGLFEKSFEEELEQGLLKKEVQHRPSWDWLHKRIAELFYDPSKAPRIDVDRAFGELSERRAARAMVKLSKSAKRDHMGSRLCDVTSPTLVLWGRQDIVTPPRVAEEFCSLLPDARLRWIENCGHAPMIECPDEFTAAISDFLDEIGDASRESSSRQEVA